MWILAVTKIWPVKSHLGELLKYVGNRSKTSADGNVNPEIMKLIGYDTDGFKTEQRLYVTGVNCTPEGAPELMTTLLKRTGSSESNGNYRVAYHAVQSFDGKECDPATAHAIGVEYAMRMWGENFPVIVATHRNTDNVHNHFAICATGFDGKRFHEDGVMRHRMMDVNDELCRKYGLSVCANREWGYKRRFAENRMRERGQMSYREQLRSDIDQVIYDVGKTTYQMQYFYDALEKMGYIVEKRGRYMRVRPDEAQRFIRLDTLGGNYTEEKITYRMKAQYFDNREPKQAFVYRKRDRAKGLYGLYLYYRYLLGNLPKTRMEDPAAYVTLREDARKVRMYSDEANLLGMNHIATYDDLKVYLNGTEERLKQLHDKRQKLRNRLRRMHDAGKMQPIKNEIHAMTKEIKDMSYNVKLAKDIAERSEVTLYIATRFEYEQECLRDENYSRTHEPPEYPSRFCSTDWLIHREELDRRAREDAERIEAEARAEEQEKMRQPLGSVKAKQSTERNDGR